MKYYFPIEENTFIDTFIIAKSCKGICLSDLLSREEEFAFLDKDEVEKESTEGI